jgi:uncharacterized membrane protein
MADLVVLRFDDTHGAQAALAAVRALQELNYAWVDDVAVVERHRSGRVSTHTAHGSVAEGAFWGGIAGIFVGLLFPPVGFLALWATGLAAGAVAGEAVKEHGLDKAMLADIRGELDKGTSALILIGAKGDADEMAHAFEPYRPSKVIRHEIPDKTVDDLKTRLSDAEQVAADSWSGCLARRQPRSTDANAALTSRTSIVRAP